MKSYQSSRLIRLAAFFFIFLSSVFHHSFICAADDANAWFLDDIHAQKGWEFLGETHADPASGVIVAVIDTGCDYSHPLIQNALWINTAEQNGITGEDDDGNGYTDDVYGVNICGADGNPMDDSVGTIQGHGTHVAGCVLQTTGVTETENPFGIRIMPIKAGDAYGNFQAADVAKALYYAVENGASVINLSISSPKFPAVLQEAVEYASRSAIIVASAGNQGFASSDSQYSSCKDFYPAACPYVVGVMSHQKNRTLSPFSNWAFSSALFPKYDITAPGESILSCAYNGSYRTMNGTSMSSGVISGCAALLVAKYRSADTLSPKDLTAHLMASGETDISFTDLYGKTHAFQSINLERLLTKDPEPRIILSDLTVTRKDSESPGFELSYSVLNRGCLAQSIKTEISADMPNASVQTDTKPPLEISALSIHNGSCRISVPKDADLSSLLFTVSISCENGANLSDKKVYTVEKSISFPADDKPQVPETKIPLQGITVSASPYLILKAGDSLPLSVSYIPENTTDDKTLTFQSSNPDVANISENGIIYAKKQGTAKITVASSKNHIRRLTVSVYDKTDAAPQEPVQTKPDSEAPAIPAQKKGAVFTVNGMKYKITSATKSKIQTVTLLGTTRKKTSLRSLTVKNTVQNRDVKFQITAIAANAFCQCKNLKTVKIGNAVQKIGSKSFFKCTALKSVSIGTGLSKISSRAFAGCKKLNRITVKSKKVTGIGTHAFHNIHPKAKIQGKKSFLTLWSEYQRNR